MTEVHLSGSSSVDHADGEAQETALDSTLPVVQSTSLETRVAAKAARKLRAQRHKTRTVWFGLGVMGLVGWSVAVPTVAGIALGRWLDSRFPGPHSFTLMLFSLQVARYCDDVLCRSP